MVDIQRFADIQQIVHIQQMADIQQMVHIQQMADNQQMANIQRIAAPSVCLPSAIAWQRALNAPACIAACKAPLQQFPFLHFADKARFEQAAHTCE